MVQFIRGIAQSDTFRFFLNPDFISKEFSLREKSKSFIVALKFEFKAMLVWFFLMSTIFLIASLIKLDLVGLIFSRFHLFKGLSKAKVFLFAVIYAPIVEELAFRSFLNFKRATIALSIGALFFSLGRLFLGSHFQWWQFALVSLLLIGIVFFALKESWLNQISERAKRQALYFSCLFFALLHLHNYSWDNPSVGLFFILLVSVLPQGIASISLSYVRLKNGLYWSIIYHALHNLISITPLLLRN